jgi:hypothetical protein
MRQIEHAEPARKSVHGNQEAEMSVDTTIFVDCFRDGTLMRTYDFLCPATLGPTTPPRDEDLILEAKNNLSTERLAAPPYDGIRFVVRR